MPGTPVAANAPAVSVSHDSTPSVIDTSQYWPRPVLSRTRSNDQLTVMLETTCAPDDIVAGDFNVNYRNDKVAQDPIFQSAGAARERLVAAFDLDRTEPEWALAYRWDIVLARTPFEDA